MYSNIREKHYINDIYRYIYRLRELINNFFSSTSAIHTSRRHCSRSVHSIRQPDVISSDTL